MIKKNEDKSIIKNNLIMQIIKSSEELKQYFSTVASGLPFESIFFI